MEYLLVCIIALPLWAIAIELKYLNKLINKQNEQK